MKSDVIAVASGQDQRDEVLVQAEKTAVFGDLSPKGTLHLRLLAEEMMSMVHAIAGDVRGVFWIENQKDQYELHLNMKTALDFQQRRKLLEASSSGQNEAHRGFMGKLRAFFEPIEDVPIFYDVAPSGHYNEMAWTMSGYAQKLKESMAQNREGAAQAWDELEKSVIAHVADEVRVSIRGYDVEMVIYKSIF